MINRTMSYDYEYIKAFLSEQYVFEWTLHTMLVDEMFMTLTTIGEHEWTSVQSRFSREWAKMSNQWLDTVGNRRVRAYTWADVGVIFEDVDKDVLMCYVRDETKMLFDRKHVARMLVCWQRWSDEME
jgi:hypothetical protein